MAPRQQTVQFRAYEARYGAENDQMCFLCFHVFCVFSSNHVNYFLLFLFYVFLCFSLLFPLTLPRMYVFLCVFVFFSSASTNFLDSGQFLPLYILNLSITVPHVFLCFFLKLKKLFICILCVFVFFWVTSFRPGYKTHVFYVFFCVFSNP